MAKTRIITYDCEQCGSEIVVTSTGESQLSPLYCCGLEVSEVSSAQKKKVAKPAKKAAPKVTKKTVKKKVTAKKKPAAKKKSAKK
jgi:hypothetical protein